MEKSKEIIKILGLSRSEQRILSAISTEFKNISEISRVTKIPRTSLGYILYKLKGRSLVFMEIKGVEKRWKSNLGGAVSGIQQTDSSVSIYKGKDLLTIFKKITSLPKNTRLYGIQPDKSFREALRKNALSHLLKINEKIKDKKLIVDGLVHEESINSTIRELGRKNAKGLFKSFVGRLAVYTKIPKEFDEVNSEMYIFEESTYFVDWNKEIAVGIHDKSMTNLFVAMFSCVKAVGNRYEHLKKMEDAKLEK